MLNLFAYINYLLYLCTQINKDVKQLKIIKTMQHIIATIPFMNEVKKIRKAIRQNLISLMKENNTKCLLCGERCDCPIIHNGLTDDETITLDCINLMGVEGAEYIVFEGGGCFNNGYVSANSIDIELLVEVYEWVLANKKELF